MHPQIIRLVAIFLNKTLRSLIRAWLLIIPLTLVLSIFRSGQIIHSWPAGYSVPTVDVLVALFQGFRFDLKESATAGFLLLCVFPWVNHATYRYITTTLTFIFILFSMINMHYFSFYKTPIDSLIFGLIEDDTSAVLKTIWHDFPVITSLIFVIALTWFSKSLHQYLLTYVQPDIALIHHSPWIRSTFILMALCSLLFAGKGTLRAMPLESQNLTVTTSQFLNDMIPNGVIALIFAWDNRRQSENLQDPLIRLKAMGFNAARDAAKELGLPCHNDEEIKMALTNHTRRPQNTVKKNLVFFLMESWSAEPMLYHSPQFDVLGHLAPTLDKACHFSNFDSANAGTHPSLEALLFSSPITPLTLGRIGRKPIPWSIATIAHDAGYQTLFVSSVRSGWRDLNRVMKIQGFDEIIDANSLKKIYPQATLGIWGVWDEYVFKYLKTRLNKPSKKPLFVFVLTSTNHPPYDLPVNYKRVSRNMAHWKGETNSDTLIPNLDTYHYAADLLGRFVQDMQTGHHKKDTIIAATGDHNVRSFGVYAEEKRRYLIHQVPFIIWGDKLKCGNQLDKPASHQDIFTTLFPLVGIDGPYINSGRNLLSANNFKHTQPIALFFTGEARDTQGMWQLGNPNSFVCTSSKPIKHCKFNAKNDKQERARYALLDWNIRYSLQKHNQSTH